jgi:hypothetical protein
VPLAPSTGLWGNVALSFIVSFREPYFLRLIVRPRHLHNR